MHIPLDTDSKVQVSLKVEQDAEVKLGWSYIEKLKACQVSRTQPKPSLTAIVGGVTYTRGRGCCYILRAVTMLGLSRAYRIQGLMPIE